MDIFLGAEIEGPATSKWFELQKEFSTLLLGIRDVDYGTALTSIGIISIIMRPMFFEEGGYPERRYYSRKKREADIRLRLNYQAFVTADIATRRKIYVAHILESVRIAGEKAGNEFDFERLIFDIELLLE